MYKLFIKGIVQGVGFRPFIYREAKKKGLKGEVRNTGGGVEVIVDDKNKILESLKNPPPLCKIHSVEQEKTNINDYSDFNIVKSRDAEGETFFPPDVFMCENCLRELRDKNNRRYEYYFITCTDCGPRFTIIEDKPYDRPYTSMKDFEMCQDCREEYTNPIDRRYHAQTIACHKCGPRLKLLENKKNIVGSSEKQAIRKAANLILKGEIVGIKGIGGFHIACRCQKESIDRLRKMLGREHKPFAVMAKDEEMVKSIARVSEKELEVLKAPHRSIVVLQKKEREQFNDVSELDSIGVMLPYTALHYLLFDFIDEPIVMTSANMPGEPVLTEEGITRFHLTHNRRIVNRCDDSVIKVINDRPLLLRRSRGFAPMPVGLPYECKDTICLGAETSNTFCISKGKKAFMSQHIGDCSKVGTFRFLQDTINKYIHLTNAEPRIIACDLHPEYQTTKLAEKLAEEYKCRLVRVQHHKAHIAGVAGENGLDDYVGIACDGLGFGEDERLWGGEVFRVKDNSFRHVGNLEPQYMIGGDSATKNPKKMLFAILYKFLDEKELIKQGLFDEKEARVYIKQIKEGFNVFETTSTGRVLDACSALLDLCTRSTYEGRPAMSLESMSSGYKEIEPVLVESDGKKILMTSPLFRYLSENLHLSRGELAGTAQMYIARGLYKIAAGHNKPVVFSGGVAYNRIITDYMLQKGVYVPTKAPAGDGGISYGQCVIANKK